MKDEFQFSKKPVDVSDEEQKQGYIDYLGLTEDEADFFIALHRGESTGDIIAVGAETLSFGRVLGEEVQQDSSPVSAPNMKSRPKVRSSAKRR